MADDVDVGGCLAAISDLSSSSADLIGEISPAGWESESNCPPWRVADLAAHLVDGGRSFVGNIRRGLSGSVEPPAAQPAVAYTGPVEVASALLAVSGEFVSLYEGLSPQDLDVLCFHRRGNRPVRWYAAHRLLEVAFHTRDLHISLGLPPSLSEDVARSVLPTILESNAPRTYAAGLSEERGRGERYVLSLVRDASYRWLITIDSDFVVTRGGSDNDALEIVGPASELALLAYGRASLPDLVRSGAVAVGGDATLVDRFGLVFPKP